MQHDQKQNEDEIFQGTRGTVSKESTSACFPSKGSQNLQDTNAWENYSLPPAAVC